MSKLKAIDPKQAEPKKPKVLIFGAAGVGKTWTALDFPNVYYIDSEGGATRNHYTDKLKKSGGAYMGPEHGAQSFDTVIEQIQALAIESHSYKTVVIDSISKIYNNEIAKEQDRLGDKDVFGASKRPATMLSRRLISWIDRIDMNVVIIAHEKPLWENGEQSGYTFDAWEKLSFELDLTLQIVKMGESRKARIRKSRLLGFVDNTTFDWSYANFAERYGKDIIEKASTQIVLATSAQIKELNGLLEVVKLPDGTLDKWLITAGVTCFQDMETVTLDKCLAYLHKILKTTTKEL
jgi:hypothetical protein